MKHMHCLSSMSSIGCFLTSISLILFTQPCTYGDISNKVELEIDYTELADEAEMNKRNILDFLNRSKTQEKYKIRYDFLLDKLKCNEPEPENRRGSTRRIVSGRNTSIAAVPWQVSLREKTYPICGGSVITDIWLLTAAHCLLRGLSPAVDDCLFEWIREAKGVSQDLSYWKRVVSVYPVGTDAARASDLSVRLGSSWKTHGGEMYDVKNSFVHPKYVSKSKTHDVGLVELYSQLRFSATVLPIRIVDKSFKLKANSPVIVSGWGKLKESGPSATFLQSMSIRTIAMKLCKQSGLNRKSIDPPSMFCAGSFLQPSPDACQGDSGGPIVHNGVLIGVVSWGLGCARGNFPGVYSRLANPNIWVWLHSHIGINKHDDTNNCSQV